MGESSEKRQFSRLPVELTGRVIKLDTPTVVLPDPDMKTVATDLSSSGVFIETNESFTIGDFVAVELQLSDEDEKVSVVGLVRWCKTDSPVGIGVEIVRATTTGNKRLDRYLQQCIDHVSEDG